jgi:hypothetical protein
MSLSCICCFRYAPLGTQIRHPIDYVLHEVEPVQLVLYPHVKSRCDGSLFLVAAADVEVMVMVCPAIGQPMD